MAYLPPETEGASEMLRRFGAELRRCRYRAGMSQMQLAERSGVSQPTISRLERGLAPAASTLKLVFLSEALRRKFPFGFCPHDHECNWQRLDKDGQPVPRESALMSDAVLRVMHPEFFGDAPDAEPDDTPSYPALLPDAEVLSPRDESRVPDSEAMPRTDWDMS